MGDFKQKSYKNSTIYPLLAENLEKLMKNDFQEIPDFRKKMLEELYRILQEHWKKYGNVKLNFICTHNSRRSHIAQLLAYASFHYLIKPEFVGKFFFYSGGTEVTAFHVNTVQALKEFGFLIQIADRELIQDLPYPKNPSNPIYAVQISDSIVGLYGFSKKYTDPPNPDKNFVAIMTCDQAAENCPIVFGAEKKFNLTYRDPKISDGTSDQQRIYRERVEEIGREMVYLANLFSEVNH